MNEYRIVQNGGGGKLWGIAMSYPSLVAMCYTKFK